MNATPRYNLVFVWRKSSTPREHVLEILDHMRMLAPDIHAVEVQDGAHEPAAVRAMPRRPTLVYSNMAIRTFRRKDATVIQGRVIEKEDQLAIFAAAGIRVPRSALLTPDLVLDPAVWTDHVILKPSALRRTGTNEGVSLRRTQAVRSIAPKDYPPGHPGRDGPMIVQQFINTGMRPSFVRLLTFMGEPVLMYRTRLLAARPPLTASDEALAATMIVPKYDGRIAEFIKDEGLIALGRRIHEAIPDVPLKGIDFLEEVGTGHVYTLECNPGGNAWGFSSQQFQRHVARDVLADSATAEREGERRMKAQFDGMRVIAEQLIKATRARAT